MSYIEEKTAQQQRQRGFWAKLKNPKTLRAVFWCVGWLVKAGKLYLKLTGESGFDD
jgi:hypothetical protein